MTRIVWASLLAGLLAQDPAPEAVTMARELRKHHAAAADSEVRLRLGETVRAMELGAGISLCGEDGESEHLILRLYDIRNLLAPIADSPSSDIRRWSARPDFTLDEPQEPMIGEEQIVDLLKERTGTEAWQGESMIEKTPVEQLLVVAPPALQRKVARVLQMLHRDSLAGVRLAVSLFASNGPLTLGADAQGGISDDAWERLGRQADEGGAVRRLGAIETVARTGQTVSAFSGVRRSVALRAPEGPVASTIPDGLAWEASALPSGDAYELRLGLSFTKVIAIDEVSTGRGTLRLPRFSESPLSVHRSVPAGRPVVLGGMGPLAPETGLPPHLTVIVRVTEVRP